MSYDNEGDGKNFTFNIYIYIYIYIVGGPLILGRNRGGFGPLWGYLRAVRLLGHD